MVDIIPSDILHELLNISDDLRKGYNLKEEFLDIVHHTSYDDVNT